MMKKALLILLITFVACTENCEINSAKLNELGAKAETIRIELNNAKTPALKNVLQLQLDAVKKQMDAVANECN